MKAIMFSRKLPRELSLLLAIPIALLSLVVSSIPATAAPGVDPQTFSTTLVEGTGGSVSKTVHTPTIPPKPDIVFLSDTTGSMGGVIAAVQAHIASVANQILAAQPQARFAVAQYKDRFNCPSDPFAYKLDQSLTTNLGAVQTAVNTWSADGGCDEPESDLFALDQIATSPAIGFRSDSTRIIVWFGDAPSHDETHPNSPVTLAQTIADLQAAKSEVIAVPFNHGGLGLDGFGQASQVTAATDGVLLPSQSADNAVASAILAGLHNLPVTVSWAVGPCDPNLAVTLSPAQLTVTSGADTSFTEHIAVSPSALPGSTLQCQVNALLNGQPQGAEFSERDTIVVPRHPTTLTYNGDRSQDFNDPALLRATLSDAVTGQPVGNATITFALASQTCVGTTDPAGQAQCSITPNEPAGPYAVSASFAGDGQHLASTASSTFTVNLEETSLSSTKSLQVLAAGIPVTLSATLTDPDGGAPIGGEPVTLRLGNGSDAQSCTANTDATTGIATCQVTPTSSLLGPQPVTDSFAGDQFYRAATPNVQSALVFAFLNQGAFVLGDTTTAKARATSPAPTVTWWGAQWARNNALSGSVAPDAMKGFAGSLSSTPPACGGTYTTGPGNSTPPLLARSIPSYMGVIVSSQVTKSGRTISGDIREIVVVKTDPGYSNDPGHHGIGTVLATYCSVT
jgi:Integrin beta chain VWA domain